MLILLQLKKKYAHLKEVTKLVTILQPLKIPDPSVEKYLFKHRIMSFEVETWNSLVIISPVLKTCVRTYFPWEFSQYIINIMDRWLAKLKKKAHMEG